MSDVQEALDRANDFLSTNDNEETQTIKDILKSFNEMRKKYTDALENREKVLLARSHEIYANRRKRVNDFVKNMAHGEIQNGDVKSRMSHLMDRTSRVYIDEDQAYFDDVLCTMFDRVQLYSSVDPPTKIECVAGFTKTAEVNPTNCQLGDDVHSSTTFLQPKGIEKLDGGHIRCMFDAPKDPGEYRLELTDVENDSRRIFAPVSIREYPPKLSVPRCEIVKTNPRYCTIKNEKLYVSNRDNPHLLAIDVNTGKPKQALGGDFKKGRGVVATDDFLYVSDAVRCQFAKIDVHGQLPTKWFSSEHELNYPQGMKMSQDGKLFIASMKDKRVVVFKPINSKEEWVVERTLALPHNPYDLAFDTCGNMHVAFGGTEEDENIDRIFVYNSVSGVCIREYGNGKITNPHGITIDKNDYSYVTEHSQEGRLVIFDDEGNVSRYSKSLDFPVGVCIHEDGSIFVACSLPHHILRF